MVGRWNVLHCVPSVEYFMYSLTWSTEGTVLSFIYVQLAEQICCFERSFIDSRAINSNQRGHLVEVTLRPVMSCRRERRGPGVSEAVSTDLAASTSLSFNLVSSCWKVKWRQEGRTSWLQHFQLIMLERSLQMKAIRRHQSCLVYTPMNSFLKTTYTALLTQQSALMAISQRIPAET
jgi:hypothetical protein